MPERTITVPVDYVLTDAEIIALVELCERGKRAATGADLSASYAYADSLTDLPMLEAVGHPVAVNPEVPLARLARSRRWPVEIWEPGKGTPKILVPPLPEDFTW